jgi:RNA polymerase sigma factor (sigma-70 family)
VAWLKGDAELAGRSVAATVVVVTGSVLRQGMGVGRRDERGDDELLLASARGDGVAFGVFYERHLPVVLAFVRRRTADPEAAADLTAEVFAAALVACSRYRPGEAPALGWLLGIARNKLREGARRGRRGDAARRRLGVAEIPFAEEDLAGVEELVERGSMVLARLEELPEDQRLAVWGRVVDERDYDGLAHDLGCSEELVRQRVSRGLRRLRARLENDQ